MRRIILTALFVGLSPLAYAQMDAPKQPAPPPKATAASVRPGSGATTGAENCGTPDEFKACPPLPRRNLPYYPGTKR